MARQFREQLEEEVQIEEARKAQTAQRSSAPPPPPETPPPPNTHAPTPEAPRDPAFSQQHPTDAEPVTKPDERRA